MQFFDSHHRRRLLAGGIAVAALGLGGTGVAIARSGGDAAPAYTSSVTVADTGEGAANDAAPAAAAKITPDQARAAALAAVPGTSGKIELDNENGNVVFGVEVTTATGSRIDVKVDAGNGKVLAQESDDAGEQGATSGADNESRTEVNPPTAPTTAK